MVITGELTVRTPGRGHHELTAQLRKRVEEADIEIGLCSLHVLHTSASLIVCENADPDVLSDLERYMERLVIDGDRQFAHDAEGPDDMPAHIRSVLTHSDITLPIRAGQLVLGTWAGVFLWEHRTHAHQRTVMITLIGE